MFNESNNEILILYLLKLKRKKILKFKTTMFQCQLQVKPPISAKVINFIPNFGPMVINAEFTGTKFSSFRMGKIDNF